MLLPISYFLNDDANVFIINMNNNIKAIGINITNFFTIKNTKITIKITKDLRKTRIFSLDNLWFSHRDSK
jgi:hypothetical protein